MLRSRPRRRLAPRGVARRAAGGIRHRGTVRAAAGRLPGRPRRRSAAPHLPLWTAPPPRSCTESKTRRSSGIGTAPFAPPCPRRRRSILSGGSSGSRIDSGCGCTTSPPRSPAASCSKRSMVSGSSGSGARSSRPVPGRRAAQRCAPRRTERAGARSSAPIDPGFTRSQVLPERARGHGRALHGSARAARFPDPGSEDRCRARSQELPLMTTPDFMVIAHRGASSYAPENTLAAFDLAIQMGVSHIELDVHFTRDGHVVVIHDDTVNRTTNGSGPVTSHALAALQGLDAGSWFGGKFAGQRIPTFEEVLERYQGRAHLHTEIKGHSAHLSQRTADLVRRRGMAGQVTITSFQRTRLEEARAHAPELPRGWLVTEVSDRTIAQARALELSQLCPRANAVTPELVHRLHAEGFVVRAWGVATEDQMRQVVQAGADGMTVNFPDRLLAYLKE